MRSLRESRAIDIPSGVYVEVQGKRVTVRGPKGVLTRDFSHARKVSITLNEDKIIVETHFAGRKEKALVGSVAAHIKNMILGVTRGFRYKMKIISTHFPILIEVAKDEVLIKNFLGEKAPRRARVEEGVRVWVDGQDLILEGIDVERVGQTAANIESACKIRDKDRRVFMDGIYLYERGFAS